MKDWVPKRVDFPKTAPINFFFFGRSSCGLLVGSQWPWEALEAMFVERMIGLNPPKSQGIDGLGSQEGRLSKNRAQFFCLVGPFVGSLPVGFIFLAFYRFYLSPGVRTSGTPGQVLNKSKRNL